MFGVEKFEGDKRRTAITIECTVKKVKRIEFSISISFHSFYLIYSDEDNDPYAFVDVLLSIIIY